MKPHLRNGSPVGRTARRTPSLNYICTCPECAQYTAYDPNAGQFVGGKLCARDEFYRHRNRLRYLQASLPPTPPDINRLSLVQIDDVPLVSSAMLGLPDHNPTPLPLSTSDDVQPSDEHASVRQREVQERIRSANDASSIFALEELSGICKNIRNRIDSVCWNDVVFIQAPSPSKHDSPPVPPVPATPPPATGLSDTNTGPYALEFGRAANKTILELEAELSRVLDEVDATWRV